MTADPFRVDQIPAVLRRPLEAALGVPALRRIYACVRADRWRSPEPFEARVLRALDIRSEVSDADLGSLPIRGPAVVTANHPHGALDGLLMLDLVRRVRPDVRVLANRALQRIPELRDSCFFVDPYEGPRAAARSLAGLRAARLWLRRGGVLVVFPAGEVGHAWIEGSLLDGRWKTTFERLAAATGARIVPAVIDGRNSAMFYAAGRLHPWIRTALLGRELLKKRGQTVRVRIGQRGDTAGEIAGEIARLDEGACLVKSGALRVFCADAGAIPSTLREIGRLRELAFRAVGEGTGRAVDLDQFDHSYLHLFIWHTENKHVVGAYRVGRSDRIAEARGVRGLYTRTLFHYDQRFLARLGAPALELGRSFVRAEYQKHYSALLMLWRGIGEFVARHPQYRFLFGPVSISARYTDASHAMLIEFLRQNRFDRDLAELVDAPAPAQVALPGDGAVPGSIEALDQLIARSESDGKGIPVLLRQYLKLNARLLGVSVDPAFGDAVDALMLVDLTAVDAALLQRYLGKRGAASFLAFHQRERSTRAA